MKKNKNSILTIVICLVLLFGYNTFFSSNSSTSIDTNNPQIVQKQEERYYFRNDDLLESHYQKHGIEMGFDTKEEYELAASNVIQNPKALHKLEKEDGDDVYYVEETNEFVILSKDGYIRTYFYPDAGISYFNKK